MVERRLARIAARNCAWSAGPGVLSSTRIISVVSRDARRHGPPARCGASSPAPKTGSRSSCSTATSRPAVSSSTSSTSPPRAIACSRPTCAASATPTLPLDATRGLRDWADDTGALLDALAIYRTPHLVGWSTGGAAIAAFAMEQSGRVADLHRPGRPYGYGAAGSTGRPTRGLRRLGRRGREPGVRRPDRGRRQVRRRGNRPAQRAATAPTGASGTATARARGPARGELLKSVTGDDGYPGDVVPSEHWPGIAPGTVESSTRSPRSTATGRGWSTSRPSRRCCGRTARRTSWSPTARLGSWGRSARWRGRGWPGADGVPAAADGGPDPGATRGRYERPRGARARWSCSSSRATSRRWTRASAGTRASSASWGRS